MIKWLLRVRRDWKRYDEAMRLARLELGYCEGDTATHYTGMDFDVCFKKGCGFENGGPCIVAVREAEILQDLKEAE